MFKRYIIWHTYRLVRNEFNYILFSSSLMLILSSSMVAFIFWKLTPDIIRMFIVGLILQAYLILYFIFTKGYKWVKWNKTSSRDSQKLVGC